MKAIQPSTIVCLFSFLLLFCAAMPAQGQRPASAGLVGEWCNKDFATRGNTRIHVRSDGTKLMVQMWGRCHPTECDWGETAAFQDPKDNSTWVTWTTGFSVTSQKLTLLPDGNLELAGHTHYTDSSGRADRDSKEIFVKGLVHDWSDTAKGQPRVPTPPTPPTPPPPPVPPTPPPVVKKNPPPPPSAPQPKQAIFGVDTYGYKKNVIKFTFKTALPVIAKVQISRKPLVNNALQTVLASAASPAPTKTHTIDVYGVGDEPRELFYYVITAGAERKTGTCYSNNRID
jgi:hypothetical protein